MSRVNNVNKLLVKLDLGLILFVDMITREVRVAALLALQKAETDHWEDHPKTWRDLGQRSMGINGIWCVIWSRILCGMTWSIT